MPSVCIEMQDSRNLQGHAACHQYHQCRQLDSLEVAIENAQQQELCESVGRVNSRAEKEMATEGYPNISGGTLPTEPGTSFDQLPSNFFSKFLRCFATKLNLHA